MVFRLVTQKYETNSNDNQAQLGVNIAWYQSETVAGCVELIMNVTDQIKSYIRQQLCFSQDKSFIQ